MCNNRITEFIFHCHRVECFISIAFPIIRPMVSVGLWLFSKDKQVSRCQPGRIRNQIGSLSYPSGGGVLAWEKQNGKVGFSKAAVVMPFESSLTKAPASLLPETTQRFFIACFARSARMALPYCTWQRRGAIRIWCNCCWPIKPRSMPGALAVARLWARRCVQAAVT